MDTKTKIRLAISSAAIISLVFGVSVSLGSPDVEISYQGKLTDTSDVAVADGNYDFILTIWDAASGGNCLWSARGNCGTPTAKSVAVSKGIFTTRLGESGDNTLSLDFNSNVYLEVQIGSDSPMDVRKKIGASGFAVNSLKLDGQAASYYLDLTNATNQDQIDHGSISGLTDDDHTQYALLAGRSGGQTFYGGTGSGDDLILASTSDATKGDIILNSGGGNVGIGTATPTGALLVLKNPTTGNMIQLLNSASSTVFQVSNSGAITGPVSLQASSTNEFIFYGAKNTANTEYGFQLTNANNRQFTAGVGGVARITSTFSPTSGTGTYNTIYIAPTINQTGGANGATRGIYMDPTLTAAFSWRAIDIASNQGYGIYQSGASAQNYFAGRVGIGIGASSPDELLHVRNSVDALIKLETTSSSNASQIQFTRNGIDSWLGPTSTSFDLWVEENLPIILATNNAEVMRINADGTVGINNASPSSSYKLDITGSVNATTGFYENGTKITDGSYWALSGTDIYNSNAGNVGIGTAAPAGKLEVTGTGDINIGRFTGNSATYGTLWTTNSASEGYALYAYQGNVIVNQGKVGIGTTAPAYELDVDAATAKAHVGNVLLGAWPSNTGYSFIGADGLDHSAAGNYSFLISSGGTTYMNAPTGQSLRFRINNADRMILDTNGYFGIGTTAPSQQLEVYASYPRVYINQATNGLAALANTMGGLDLSAASMNATSKYTPAIKFGSTDPNFTTTNPKFLAGIVGRATETYGADTNSGMALDFFTTPNAAGATPTLTTKMTLDQDGNLGIGTTLPEAKLTIWDNTSDESQMIRIGASSASDYKIYRERSSGILTFQGNQNGYNGYNFKTDDGASRLRILESGNVGIGIDSPVYKFQVAGNVLIKTADTYPLVIHDANAQNIFYINSAGQGFFKYLAGTGNRLVYSDSNGILTNSSSDARLKKNVETISDDMDVLASLEKLRGVYYNWDTSNDAAKDLGDQREIGLIAQEVQKVLPELIGVNSTGYYSLDYPKLTGFIIEVDKAQQKMIETLKIQMAELEARIGIPSESDLAQIEINRTDIDYLKTLLGIDRVAENGDIDLLGRLSVKEVETGRLIISVSDEDKRTIGEGVILKEGEESTDGESDGLSVKVVTQAVKDGSRIFITPKDDASGKSLYVSKKSEGEYFVVKLSSSQGEAVPTDKDIAFDWIIVDEE